jgi:xylulokinase
MLLTVEIGTSNFKAAVWDYHGERLAYTAVPLSSQADGMRHEADTNQWLKAFAQCCATLGRTGGSSAGGRNVGGSALWTLGDVQAIVISGNGPSLVPVLGEPKIMAGGIGVQSAPARLWLDRRAEAASAKISSLMGAYVDPSFFLPKILAIKNDEPDLYRQARFFLGCPEFLAYSLTGEACSVFPAKGFDRWFWNEEILCRLELEPSKFPGFIAPADTFGSLLPHVAASLGLKPNIPVISGGPDFFAAIIGTGITSPGQVCDRSGPSEGINACTSQQITDSRLMSYAHPIKPFWNLSGIISTTGRAIEWARDLLGLQTYNDFFTLADNARLTNADNGDTRPPVFLPYLAGERAPIWDTKARAVFRNLSLSSGRPEFARAVLEGICFAIRDVLSVMEEAGAETRELRVTGSAAASPLLNQLKADITGREVLIPLHHEAELLGLAIIGSFSLGKYDSLATAASSLVSIESRFQPNQKKAAYYDELFTQYRETYRKLGE